MTRTELNRISHYLINGLVAGRRIAEVTRQRPATIAHRCGGDPGEPEAVVLDVIFALFHAVHAILVVAAVGSAAFGIFKFCEWMAGKWE